MLPQVVVEGAQGRALLERLRLIIRLPGLYYDESFQLTTALAFCTDAHHRVQQNFHASGHNNDEEIKVIADEALTSGRYQEDILK